MILNQRIGAIHLLLSIFMFLPSNSSPVPIRMYIGQVNKMIAREAYLELMSMTRNERQKCWKKTSQQYFKNRSCRETQIQPCSISFMFCNLAPNKSGYERKKIIRNAVLAQTPQSKRKWVEIEDIPFYNSQDKTCFMVSMTPKISRRLAQNTCESKEKNCVIHPLLPMIKLSNGTVEDVTTIVQDQDNPYLNVMAELSPYYKKNKSEVSLQKLVESTIQISKDNCVRHLPETLPSTGKSMGCNHTLLLSEIGAQWMDEKTVSFTLNPSGGAGNKSILREKILRFISSLAIRPEFTSIEVTPYYYYYYIFDRPLS